MSDYKGEAHYWTEDADGDPVRHITKSPLRPGKWYREHTVQELRDEHTYRGLHLPQEGGHDVEQLARSLRTNDKSKPLTEVHTPEEIRDGIRTSIHGSRGVFVPAPGVTAATGVTSTTVQKWADQAMFTAEPIDAQAGPTVSLLWMTADPLAVIAAPSAMYKGDVKRSLRDVTHAERREYIEQIKATKLKAPFEFVKFHFLIEGVTRAFTHQMVRQRTAVYAQESLRFAVKEDMPVALPPSLAGTEGGAEKRVREAFAGHKLEFTTGADGWEADDAVSQAYLDALARVPEEERQREKWDAAIQQMGQAYKSLVEAGIPAEDARGLLPHNTLTRLHYCTDLRALLDHAGNRLCTQAQFEWRLVFARIAEAIRNYNPYANLSRMLVNSGDHDAALAVDHCYEADRWQYEAIAGLFAPVCYQTGKCEFKANFDRACSIRSRVDAYHERGIPSSQWSEGAEANTGGWEIGAIRPAEWLLNPGAAR
jgi:flavin-dependent thymidylate synthase